MQQGSALATQTLVLTDLQTSERGGWEEQEVGVCRASDQEKRWKRVWFHRGRKLSDEGAATDQSTVQRRIFDACLLFGVWTITVLTPACSSDRHVRCEGNQMCFFSYSWSWMCCTLGLSWTGGLLTGTLSSAGKMEEICTSLFRPALSAHKVRSTFIRGPAEKYAVLTVATVLARNVYHIGGSVAVPQKCRLTQIGKLTSLCVYKCSYRNAMCLTEENWQILISPPLLFP